jgi:hypothetical protein
METTVPTIDAPEGLKLVVFEKPTRSDQIVAAITAAAATVVATTVVTVGSQLIHYGLAARATKKQARKDAAVQTTETETPDEDQD